MVLVHAPSSINVLLPLIAAGLCTPACTKGETEKPDKPRPSVAVEVADITVGPLDDFRSFTGTLEASASFTAASKVGGRIEALTVDIGDKVARGATVARLDADELKQAVTRAEADLLVAEANLTETKSAIEIAERTMARAQTLRDRGVASEADLDEARTKLLTERSKEAVFRAQLTRARATLKTAKIQVSYAKVSADWQGDDAHRVIAERFVDEGETAVANAPLVRIVALTPITAVFFVTEKDYPNLGVGRSVRLVTDAFPGESFEGAVSRIAPVFKSDSRQARVEVTVPNADERLKPGMFVTASIQVSQVERAMTVPADALVTRDDTQGVFILNADGASVRWQPVEVGVRNGKSVQILGNDLKGRVVTLGQQLLENGAKVTVRKQTERGGAPGKASP